MERPIMKSSGSFAELNEFMSDMGRYATYLEGQNSNLLIQLDQALLGEAHYMDKEQAVVRDLQRMGLKRND